MKVKRIFSLNTLSNRKDNLPIILPAILNQCDLLYVNLINYYDDVVPDILNNDKIIINRWGVAGSEYRFYNYNDCDDDTYYFTIDDDILYPLDYSDVLIENMKLYNNEAVCCVHFSNLISLKGDNVYRNRTGVNFKLELKQNTKAMIAGIGTACFYKKNVKINLSDFKVPNMSDPYVANFLKKQSINIIAIKRKELWMKSLNEFGVSIFGNNPLKEIDKVLKEVFL